MAGKVSRLGRIETAVGRLRAAVGAVVPTIYVVARRGGYGGVPWPCRTYRRPEVLAGVAEEKNLALLVPLRTELVYDCGSRSNTLGR
jgi:hypothetical protein